MTERLAVIAIVLAAIAVVLAVTALALASRETPSERAESYPDGSPEADMLRVEMPEGAGTIWVPNTDEGREMADELAELAQHPEATHEHVHWGLTPEEIGDAARAAVRPAAEAARPRPHGAEATRPVGELRPVGWPPRKVIGRTPAQEGGDVYITDAHGNRVLNYPTDPPAAERAVPCGRFEVTTNHTGCARCGQSKGAHDAGQ